MLCNAIDYSYCHAHPVATTTDILDFSRKKNKMNHTKNTKVEIYFFYFFFVKYKS